MYNLEDKLKARLANLKNKNKDTNNSKNYISNTSPEYIENSLKQAGILNKKGKLTNMVIA